MVSTYNLYTVQLEQLNYFYSLHAYKNRNNSGNSDNWSYNLFLAVETILFFHFLFLFGFILWFI